MDIFETQCVKVNLLISVVGLGQLFNETLRTLLKL